MREKDSESLGKALEELMERGVKNVVNAFHRAGGHLLRSRCRWACSAWVNLLALGLFFLALGQLV
jgi:hypothetical protein